MPQQRTLELTEQERQDLLTHRDHDPHPFVRERCAALLNIAEGQSPHRVAQQGLLKLRDPDTLYQWLNYYEKEGLSGLLAHSPGGARRRRLRPPRRTDRALAL